MTKLIIISAPSGTGKSTLINKLLAEHEELRLKFSISATSRLPRGTEKDGVEYRFLTADDFRAGIAKGEFLEYEEVYTDKFYGTPKADVEQLLADGYNVLFDVDTVGALNIKKVYGNRALAIFIMPPSIDELRRRLESRATDACEVIAERVEKAKSEITKADAFDCKILNDDFDICYTSLVACLKEFLMS